MTFDRLKSWVSLAGGRLPGVSLLLAFVVLAVFVSPTLTVAFQFDRSVFDLSKVWQVFSSHLTHFTWAHLFWDLLVFMVLASLCELRNRKQMVMCILVSAPAIMLSVLIMRQEIFIYRGLSGIDSALFVMLAVNLIVDQLEVKDYRRLAVFAVCLLAFFGKTCYELMSGGTLFVDPKASGMIPVPLSHVVGGVVGGVIAMSGLRKTCDWCAVNMKRSSGVL